MLGVDVESAATVALAARGVAWDCPRFLASAAATRRPLPLVELVEDALDDGVVMSQTSGEGAPGVVMAIT